MKILVIKSITFKTPISVMFPGSAEWWLDDKGTKSPESPGMQQYKVTAQCVKHTSRNAKHEPSRGVWGHAPRKC